MGYSDGTRPTGLISGIAILGRQRQYRIQTLKTITMPLFKPTVSLNERAFG